MLDESSWKQFGTLTDTVLREAEKKRKAQEAFFQEFYAQERPARAYRALIVIDRVSPNDSPDKNPAARARFAPVALLS